MPKFMEKLKRTESAELAESNSQGILTSLSAMTSFLVTWRARTTGQRKRVLKRPREERKRDIW